MESSLQVFQQKSCIHLSVLSRTTWPTHLILPDFIFLIIFGRVESLHYKAFRHLVFSSPQSRSSILRRINFMFFCSFKDIDQYSRP
jgi:hypothetical protein